MPPESSGYIPPKSGPKWNADKGGYVDRYGNVWVKDKSNHGGEHWDVQYPNGGYDNVYPDGKVREGKGTRGRFSPKVSDKPKSKKTDDTKGKKGKDKNSKKIDWDGATKAGLLVTGIGIIAFTVVEDVITGGAGIADDPATISTGIGFIIRALA